MSEPLRALLLEGLPEQPVKLKENEIITEAVVVYRIQKLDDSDERYRYSTAGGCSYGLAVGMAVMLRKMLEDFIDFDRDTDEDDE